MFAAQDGVVHTRGCRATMLGHDTSPICPKCRIGVETVGHILSGCSVYNWSVYKDRHDKVLYQIVRAVATQNNLAMPETLHWGQGQWTGQGTVGSAESLLIQVDTLLNTSTSMMTRRRDLVIRNAATREISICDVAVAWEPLILEREQHKRAKYEPLARDMGRRRASKDHRVVVWPLVLGDLGSIAHLARELRKMKILSEAALKKLIANCQLDVVYSATRLIQSHLAMK